MSVNETISKYLAGELHPQRSLSDVLQGEYTKDELAKSIMDYVYEKAMCSIDYYVISDEQEPYIGLLRRTGIKPLAERLQLALIQHYDDAMDIEVREMKDVDEIGSIKEFTVTVIKQWPGAEDDIDTETITLTPIMEYCEVRESPVDKFPGIDASRCPAPQQTPEQPRQPINREHPNYGGC